MPVSLVIAKDGVKREIETPFAICCTTEDLGFLIKELETVYHGRLGTNMTYGWSRIDPSHPSGIPGEPKGWTE